MSNKVKILVGEDDIAVRFMMNASFKEIGIAEQVQFQSDGKQFLNYLESITDPTQLPVLVILDLRMPIISGMELLRYMKETELYKDIPVIIFSNSINPQEKEECLKTGAFRFFVKPVTYEEYISFAKLFQEYSDKGVS